MNAREVLKRRLFEERGFSCEILPFLLHFCNGALDMHETIYTRNDIRGVKGEARKYINDERNCVLVCHELHISDGRTDAYRIAAAKALVARYGAQAIRDYIFCAPFKVKNAVSQFVFWGPHPPSFRMWDKYAEYEKDNEDQGGHA